jgi:hypothetical protein
MRRPKLWHESELLKERTEKMEPSGVEKVREL